MFPPVVLRIIIVVALASHGVAHAIALGGLVAQGAGSASASQVEVRSWLLPGVVPNLAAAIAIPLWLAAMGGFLAATLSFWGFLVPDAAWRQIAVWAAIVSLVGVGFLAGFWPGSPRGFQNLLNVGVAVAMDLAILVTQLWLRWPDESALGA